MAKPSIGVSIEAIIEDAVAGVVERAIGSIRAAIEARVAAELKAAGPRGRGAGRRAASRRRPRREITRWVADNRARRVPNFVIEATGLDTKKKIVARYGEDATFEMGKPLPKAK